LELQDSINRENLETLVSLFYHKAMEDDQIGHFFVLELGTDITNEDWKEHIDILVDFWALVFINDPTYKSDPYGPHFTISDLSEEDFTRWVELFAQTAEDVYVQEVANLFREKGVAYAKDFMSRLKVKSGVSELFWV